MTASCTPTCRGCGTDACSLCVHTAGAAATLPLQHRLKAPSICPCSSSISTWPPAPLVCLQLLGISWTIGPFVATFLLLPPVHHLMVQIPALVALMRRNRSGAAV